MRLPPLLMVLGQVLLLSLHARAQGTAAPLAPPQSLPRTVTPPPALPPPPPPAVVRDRMPRLELEPGAYLHDGFYLRFGVGAGYVIETIEWTDVGAASSEVKGPAFPIDLAMGGTLGSGFVLGGVLHTMLLSRQDRPNLGLPESERGGQHALSALGLFADWYVDPAAGFHIQGMLGAGSLLMSDTADTDYMPTGTTASIGVGHAWWIGPDSSLGILARVDSATLTYQDDEDVDYEHRLLHVGFMGTATYH